MEEEEKTFSVYGKTYNIYYMTVKAKTEQEAREIAKSACDSKWELISRDHELEIDYVEIDRYNEQINMQN